MQTEGKDVLRKTLFCRVDPRGAGIQIRGLLIQSDGAEQRTKANKKRQTKNSLIWGSADCQKREEKGNKKKIFF